jgi:tRNA dimethylallyltransferase
VQTSRSCRNCRGSLSVWWGPRHRARANWRRRLRGAYSVALYQDYARRKAAELDAAGKRVVLCGGTGLYVRSVIDGYAYPKGDQTHNPVRDKYTQVLAEVGPDALWQQLNEADPASAALIHPHNTRRVIRAFELLAEGKSYAQQKKNLAHIPQVVPAVQIGLAVDRAALNARIDARVDAMFAEGLVREVKGLLAAGFRDALTAPQAIGYKEVVAALDGEYTMAQAADRIKTATRRYAKRQRSWFGRDKRIHWLDAARAGERPGLPETAGAPAEAPSVSADAAMGAASHSDDGAAPADFRDSSSAFGNTRDVDTLVTHAMNLIDTIESKHTDLKE